MDEEELKKELEKWEREIALNPENARAYFKRGNIFCVWERRRKL